MSRLLSTFVLYMLLLSQFFFYIENIIARLNMTKEKHQYLLKIGLL